MSNCYFSAEKKGNGKIPNGIRKLIMKNKERLLDTDEPLRFVFSHYAFRESWDNLNVFRYVH